MTIYACAICKNPLDNTVKHIIAYVDGKEIYSKFCKDCIKRHWMNFKNDRPEIFNILNKE